MNGYRYVIGLVGLIWGVRAIDDGMPLLGSALLGVFYCLSTPDDLTWRRHRKEQP